MNANTPDNSDTNPLIASPLASFTRLSEADQAIVGASHQSFREWYENYYADPSVRSAAVDQGEALSAIDLAIIAIAIECGAFERIEAARLFEICAGRGIPFDEVGISLERLWTAGAAVGIASHIGETYIEFPRLRVSTYQYVSLDNVIGYSTHAIKTAIQDMAARHSGRGRKDSWN